MAWRIPVAALLALTVAGCAPFQGPEPPPPRDHLLRIDAAELPALEARGGTLLVAEVRPGVGLDGRAMLYARPEAPDERARYSRSRWAESPADLLGEALVEALEASGGFDHVVRPPLDTPADYRLEVELVRLVQHIGNEAPGEVELVVRARLLDRGRALLGSRRIAVHEPTPSDDVPGGVAAANRALQAAVGELLEAVDGWRGPASAGQRGEERR